MSFIGLNIVQKHVDVGNLLVLAITGNKRSPLAPDVPTIAEGGLPSFTAGTWYGVLGPANTPREAVTKLNEEINRIFTLDDMRKLLANTGSEPAGMSPQEFGSFMVTERAKWTKVVKAANIKIKQ